MIFGDEAEEEIRAMVRSEMEVAKVQKELPYETIRELIREEIQLNKEEKGQAPNDRGRAGFSWSDFEERDLIRELKDAIVQIARRHERTEISISYKLENLNKEGRFCSFKNSVTWEGR